MSGINPNAVTSLGRMAKTLQADGQVTPKEIKQFLDASYGIILNRAPDPVGAQYFANSLSSGRLTMQQAIAELLAYKAGGGR